MSRVGASWRTRAGQTGPYAIAYEAKGSGVMFSRAATGWAISAALSGRGVVLGWVYLGVHEKTLSRRFGK